MILVPGDFLDTGIFEVYNDAALLAAGATDDRFLLPGLRWSGCHHNTLFDRVNGWL